MQRRYSYVLGLEILDYIELDSFNISYSASYLEMKGYYKDTETKEDYFITTRCIIGSSEVFYGMKEISSNNTLVSELVDIGKALSLADVSNIFGRQISNLKEKGVPIKPSDEQWGVLLSEMLMMFDSLPKQHSVFITADYNTRKLKIRTRDNYVHVYLVWSDGDYYNFTDFNNHYTKLLHKKTLIKIVARMLTQ